MRCSAALASVASSARRCHPMPCHQPSGLQPPPLCSAALALLLLWPASPPSGFSLGLRVWVVGRLVAQSHSIAELQPEQRTHTSQSPDR